TPTEYRARFPAETTLIDDVFEKAMSLIELSGPQGPGAPLEDSALSKPGDPRSTALMPRGLAEPAAAPPGGSPDRPFRILRRHARGGLGEVFVALDERLHREVALKMIGPRHAGDARSRSRFLLEAEVTGRLEHPGIVPVHALGWSPDGQPYYVMKL